MSDTLTLYAKALDVNSADLLEVTHPYLAPPAYVSSNTYKRINRGAFIRVVDAATLGGEEPLRFRKKELIAGANMTNIDLSPYLTMGDDRLRRMSDTEIEAITRTIRKYPVPRGSGLPPNLEHLNQVASAIMSTRIEEGTWTF